MDSDQIFLMQVEEFLRRAIRANEKVEQLERVTLSVEEAAEVLGISRGHAYAAVKDGEIPSIRLGDRLLIPITSLTRMLANSGSFTPRFSAASGSV